MLKMTNSSINDRIYNSYLETTRDEELQFAQRVAFPDNMQIDAFGRIRTSLPSVVFDNYEIQGKKTLVWNEKLTGAAIGICVSNLKCARRRLFRPGRPAAPRSRKSDRTRERQC
jgi:hypothetical protein